MQAMLDRGPTRREDDAPELGLVRSPRRARPGEALDAELALPTWATPTRERRAQALLAAWRAETRDLGQRALLREMLAHFRRECVRAGHADPLRGDRARRAG